eukprot:167526_1
MQSIFFSNVVINQCPAIFQLFSCKDQSLLLWRDAHFILNLCLHIDNRITWFHIQDNRLSGQCLHKTNSCTNTWYKYTTYIVHGLIDITYISADANARKHIANNDNIFIVFSFSFALLLLAMYLCLLGEGLAV